MVELTSVCTREGEIITPHQTVLLKLLDSYFQTAHLTVETCQQLCPVIASAFFDLGEYSISAIDRAAPNIYSPASAPPPPSPASSSGTDSSTSRILTPPELSFIQFMHKPLSLRSLPENWIRFFLVFVKRWFSWPSASSLLP